VGLGSTGLFALSPRDTRRLGVLVNIPFVWCDLGAREYSLPALPLSLFYELALCLSLSIVLFVSSHLSMFSLVFFFRTATTSWCCYSLFFSFCIQISSYFFC
jgi:hypothetical protein